MISDKNSIVFQEAAKAQRKFKPVIQILIFFLVYLIFYTIANLIVAVPMVITIANSFDELEPMVLSSDVSSITSFIQTNPSVLISSLFAVIVSYIVCFFYAKKVEKRNAVSLGYVRKGAPLQFILGFIIGAAMMVAAGLLSAVTGNGEFTLNPSINYPMLILFFIGYLIQGGAEEIMNRGFLMVSLRSSFSKSKHKNIWAALISSLIFAILHGLNPGMTFLSFFNLFGAGLFFAVLFIRFDNIWICSAAHTAWNFFQGHILGASVSGLPSPASVFMFNDSGSHLINGGKFGFEGGLMVTLVQLIAIALLIFLPSKRTENIAGLPHT